MNIDRERYKICLQCMSELPQDMIHSNVLMTSAVMERIRVKIETGRMWKNPIYGWFDLCEMCPYVVEHTVISQREVHEHRDKWSLYRI